MVYAIVFAFIFVPAGVGAWLGSLKGRPLTGFLLGIFLTWPGVLISALLPRTAEKEAEQRVLTGRLAAQRRDASGRPAPDVRPARPGPARRRPAPEPTIDPVYPPHRVGPSL